MYTFLSFVQRNYLPWQKPGHTFGMSKRKKRQPHKIYMWTGSSKTAGKQITVIVYNKSVLFRPWWKCIIRLQKCFLDYFNCRVRSSVVQIYNLTYFRNNFFRRIKKLFSHWVITLNLKIDYNNEWRILKNYCINTCVELLS